MHKYLLYCILFLYTLQISHSQENGVVALDLPVRNSLKFNRHAVNPTFSFVREQNRYITFTNKRQWVQFDNAPQTFLFGYSGRFSENIGLGVSLFQQDYGVQTTFGGILNFAYNVSLNRESNLTFGLNVGAYQSGINEGNVIINEPDPTLQNIPKNFLLTLNPGINYGTGFFDFGFSVNNLVSYNLNSSKLIEENPAQSLQAHIMYTGYVNSRGFFDESKFSSLFRSEFRKDKTVLSGLAMLSIPKGLWGQIGYNTLYGASVGVGINISEQIAIEYNYEQSMGDLVEFGSSHEVTLAYRFKNQRFNYSGDDEEKSVFTSSRKVRRVLASKNPTKKTGSATPGGLKSRRVKQEKESSTPIKDDELENNDVDPVDVANLEEENRKVEEAAKREAERIAQEEANRIKLAEEAKAQAAIELQEKREAEAKARALALKRKKEAEAKAREEARLEAEAKEKARLEEEKHKAEAAARLEAERIKAAEEEKARLEAERLQAEKEALEQVKREEVEATSQLEAQVIKKDSLQQPEIDDETLKSINDLNQMAEASKNIQNLLIDRLSDKVNIKQQDLDDLKEENDLSEQGIYVAPKPFKSISAENSEIESIKNEIDKVIEEQEIKIQELEAVLIKRKGKKRDKLDPLSASYLKTIEELKAERLKTIRIKENLVANLETINKATEIERKRRIKRAAYQNQQDRYEKDRVALEQIKKFTDPSNEPLSEEDFDFGEEQSDSIKIIKDVSNEENGFYMVIAVHDSEEKRDEFLRKAVAAGQLNINFFFDVNSNKYFIYYEKFDYIDGAKNALEAKGDKPYNGNMSIVKIEN
ncbi:PorP/SprF family type IX secretion system membrane protein [Seonamhaeicola aphaedonensis]|uniref:Type IX secretion system PorP/SprF family membrane protein n=1 Tax=Seonamhaeicola aphaedonensis TaxID=1461338 RepID=A0A3D9HIM5_9FLAO|nr:PorP/SprF family type IX secretion system membrane protein [Seonamhaeicola aphaedonensis]RED49313.1 type IX secretion system PorP/SprF family membrane protein [Seonamhaeicola aphaedonensis]